MQGAFNLEHKGWQVNKPLSLVVCPPRNGAKDDTNSRVGSRCVHSRIRNILFRNGCICIICSGISINKRRKRSLVKLETLKEGQEFEIPILSLDGIVIRQSYGSTWVKYYNYIDPFDEDKNIKVVRQVIAPGTMVRRK